MKIFLLLRLFLFLSCLSCLTFKIKAKKVLWIHQSVCHNAKTKCRKFETNIPRKGISGPQSQFPHSCWVWLFCWRKYVNRSWEYINRSQTHECGNWAEAAQFPEKEYINGIAVAVHKADHHFTVRFVPKQLLAERCCFLVGIIT